MFKGRLMNDELMKETSIELRKENQEDCRVMVVEHTFNPSGDTGR